MTEEEYWKKQKEGRSKEMGKKYTKQARIDKLEGLLRFLLKNGQIRQASINVVQSILKEGDDNE
jgi:hypothetical protein